MLTRTLLACLFVGTGLVQASPRLDFVQYNISNAERVIVGLRPGRVVLYHITPCAGVQAFDFDRNWVSTRTEHNRTIIVEVGQIVGVDQGGALRVTRTFEGNSTSPEVIPSYLKVERTDDELQDPNGPANWETTLEAFSSSDDGLTILSATIL